MSLNQELTVKDIEQMRLAVTNSGTEPDSMMFTDAEGWTYVTGAFSPDGEPRIFLGTAR